jgi:hypothetical protein
MSRSVATASSILLAATALGLLGSGTALARVGVTSATDGDPLSKPPQEAERILRIGIDVQANEVIRTGANDRAHLVFLDGTALTVGPNAQLTIDKFVYDPNTKTGELAVNAVAGVFRLVGGKISKTTPISITTPSATIGIRGGICVFDVRRDRTTSTFLFGSHMSVTNQGQTQNVTRPGSQVTANIGAPPQSPIMAPQGSLNIQIGQLEGTTGGSNGPPTGGSAAGGTQTAGTATVPTSSNTQQGVQSLAQQNSAKDPTTLTTVPGPLANSPSSSTSNALTNVTASATSTVSQQQQTQAASTTSMSTTTKTSTSTNVTTGTSITQVIVSVGSLGRYIGNPAYTNFNPNDLTVTPVAANNALLSPSSNQTATTTTPTQTTAVTTTTTTTNTTTVRTGTSSNSTSTSSSTSNTATNTIATGPGSTVNTITLVVPNVGTIALPWQLNTLQTGFVLPSISDPVFGTLSGTGYVSPTGNFFAYVFTDSSGNQSGFFGGTPSSQTGGIPTTGFGTYSTVSTAGGLPFADSTINSNPGLKAAAIVSPLFAAYSSNLNWAVGQPAPVDQRATALQATVSVTGQGVNQQSYMGVYVGSFTYDANTGTTASTGGFSASYRLGGNQLIGRLTSAASTPDVGGTNAIYGPTANYIVYTPDMFTTTTTNSGGLITSVSSTRTSQAALDQPYNNLNGSSYFPVTVAVQTSTSATTSNSRTNQTLSGFVGGLIDSLNGAGTSRTTRTIGLGSSPATIVLTTSAASNRATATISVPGFTGASNTSAAFQLGGNTGADYSTSAFIDDKTYALRDRSPTDFTSGTTSVTVGGRTSTSTDVTSRTTLLSAGTTPGALNSLYAAAGVTECTCDFLTWGWWGGDIKYSANSVFNPNGRDRINFASYVAGIQATSVQLPLTGSATYIGDVVGNVRNNGNSYIAVGGFQDTWNFASKSGVLTITNFDGANYTGSAAQTTGTTQITGGFTSSATGRAGSLSGAFYGTGTPPAGQAGTLTISGTNYAAGGTFKAQR